MTTNNDMFAGKFWLRWLPACGIGLAAGLGVFLPLALGFGSEQGIAIELVLSAVGGGVLGALLGAAQWVVLRRWFGEVGAWVWLSVIGGAVGGAAAVAVGEATSEILGYPAVLIVGGAILGGALGLAQWFLLRSRLSSAGWWVPANAAGLALGFALSSGLSGALYYGSLTIIDEAPARLLATLTFVLFIVGVFGLVTGAVLAWLGRQPGAKQDKASQPAV